MWSTIVSRFRSRKFVTALIATLIGAAAYFGTNVPPELIIAVVSVFGVAIAGDAYEDGQAKSAAGPKSIAVAGDLLTAESPTSPLPEVKP